MEQIEASPLHEQRALLATIDKFLASAHDWREGFPMATAATNLKQQAHELIDRLSTGQVFAVVGLLEAMVDPVSVALANAPIDDEPVSKEEARDIAEARSSYAHGEVVSHEEVLAEFGLTTEDFERMGRTPLEPGPHHPGQ
jgi:hypothetical protein